jgi:hypothetical protein
VVPVLHAYPLIVLIRLPLAGESIICEALEGKTGAAGNSHAVDFINTSSAMFMA